MFHLTSFSHDCAKGTGRTFCHVVIFDCTFPDWIEPWCWSGEGEQGILFDWAANWKLLRDHSGACLGDFSLKQGMTPLSQAWAPLPREFLIVLSPRCILPLVILPVFSYCAHPSSLVGLILSVFCALLPPWHPRSSSLSILFSAGRYLLSRGSILAEIRMFSFFWAFTKGNSPSSCRGDFGWCFSCTPCLLHSYQLQWDFPCERKISIFSLLMAFTCLSLLQAKTLSVHHIAGKSLNSSSQPRLGWVL